ncbi:hypothetical protein C6990_05640 [Nitrosopumilus sp. b3]|uniref:hypothetical protein n=1 Tax=Nitrosopumilus sp. b3 TaxID=2109909 RepID=UPI0015F49F75|nr:hypothetical protein [Nitrosopumilus sp. b3]KAF6247160.1 hypothetical protein C6990_05640 [Nitrosopumilus sp. b3]
MKKGILAIIVGVIIGVLGIIFHLQGHSVVGPQSSFMYSNPDWVTYGIQIAIIGLIVIGAGIIAIIFKKD